jgi:hypothetical protein
MLSRGAPPTKDLFVQECSKTHTLCRLPRIDIWQRQRLFKFETTTPSGRVDSWAEIRDSCKNPPPSECRRPTTTYHLSSFDYNTTIVVARLQAEFLATPRSGLAPNRRPLGFANQSALIRPAGSTIEAARVDLFSRLCAPRLALSRLWDPTDVARHVRNRDQQRSRRCVGSNPLAPTIQVGATYPCRNAAKSFPESPSRGNDGRWVRGSGLLTPISAHESTRPALLRGMAGMLDRKRTETATGVVTGAARYD